MNIEQLSKSQIVLLTLLVSFVTSIATGIVTVSLMDQAPPTIAQTVNRVIEHTVEKVTPSGQTASVVTQEKTVVVKESDLISQALGRVDPSIVRLYTSGSDTSTFLGLGVVLDASGTIASDTGALGESGDATVERSDGAYVRAFVTSRDDTVGIAYLGVSTTTIDGKKPLWAPITISAAHPVLGETVVMLAGKAIARIADGIITALVPASNTNPQVIETSVSGDSVMPGSPLIDTDGSLIGISTGIARATSPASFVSVSVLLPASGSAK